MTFKNSSRLFYVKSKNVNKTIKFDPLFKVIYADILASLLELNLGECVKEKFNEVSECVGSDVKILD